LVKEDADTSGVRPKVEKKGNWGGVWEECVARLAVVKSLLFAATPQRSNELEWEINCGGLAMSRDASLLAMFCQVHCICYHITSECISLYVLAEVEYSPG